MISPDHLPLKSTTDEWTSDRHLLAVQSAIIDQIAQFTSGTVILDEVLHSIALALHDTLQVDSCLIFQAGRCQPLAVSTAGLPLSDLARSLGFTTTPTTVVSVATVEQESRQTPSKNSYAEPEQRLHSVCCALCQYYQSWLAQGETVSRSAIEQLLPATIQDVARDCGLVSFLIVPLLYRQSYIGGVVLYQCEQEREWTAQEIAFVKAIANQCVIALTLVDLEHCYQSEVKARQQAESALQWSQSQLRKLYNQTCQFVGLLSTDGIVLDVNQTVLDCVELQASEIVGHPFWELKWWIPSLKTTRQLKAALAMAAAGEFIRYEVNIVGKGDRVSTIDFSVQPLKDETGQVVRLFFEGRDITDDKQTQAALIASEGRNRAFLDAIPDLMFRVSRDGIYLDCKATKDDALPMPAIEMVGRHLHDVLPTEVAGLVWQHIELALETEEVQVIEYQLWLNGKSCYFEARIAKSTTNEVAVIVQDITERVQTRVVLQQVNDALETRVAERTAALREANHALRAEIVERNRIENALRESEERFRRAIVNAPFPIMIYAEDGEVLQINEVWTDLTGYTHQDIPTIGQWIQKAYGANQDAVETNIQQLYNLNNKVHEGEFTLTTKEGSSKIWNFSSASLGQLADGRWLFISIATDITVRKQADQEIRLLHSIKQGIFESQDFHAALNVALQKVCEVTGWDFGEAWVPAADGSVLECSPAWYTKSDCLEPFRSASETLTFAPGIGLPGRVWRSQQPEWRRDVSTESNQVYLRTQMAREAGLKAGLGIPLLTTDGVLAVLVFYMFESQDEDQQLIELISASTELGLMIQRKQVEGEIRKALEREKELTELKSRFVSMTSHEFRTPLTTIQSSAELLEHYSQQWSEDKKRIHLRRVQSAVKHMTKLLNDILIIGKAEAGKLEFNPVPLDLEKFCRNLVEELKLNDTQQHTIIFSVGNEENQIETREELTQFSIPKTQSLLPCLDEKLLGQIFENLLSNALKYSPKGTTVEFILNYCQNQAILQIRDRGIGIPSQDQGLLFETFHRATNVGTIAGTGLGLAIVKKCLDMHKGQISVESEVGVGTTFTVTLPVSHF